MDLHWGSFCWDPSKEESNIAKHGVGFATAAEAFRDPNRKDFIDLKHSSHELRCYCLGKVDGRVLTVRYVRQGQLIRIIGAGFWRKWRKYYEKEVR